MRGDMDMEIFLGLVFLLFWLLCEAICIWLIFRDVKDKPTVYGSAIGGIPNRPHTQQQPNFYENQE
jgi:hypothetical protein